MKCQRCGKNKGTKIFHSLKLCQNCIEKEKKLIAIDKQEAERVGL